MTTSDESRIVKDPICGKDVDTLRARAVGIFGGVTYYFCSAECKGKFKDPRQSSSAAPPMLERRRANPEKAAPEKEAPPDKESSTSSPDAVRYAHSRMRRITGDVIAPVVQIDLSPNSAKMSPAKPTSPSPGDTGANDVGDTPARSSRGLVWLALVLLLVAGGVVFYVLKMR